AGRSKPLIARAPPVTARRRGGTMPTQPVEKAMDLVGRVKNILIDPQNEWRVIDAEPDTPANILKSYVAILAAVPVVCWFIGAAIIGVGPYRTGLVFGLIVALINYGLTLVGVYVIALLIDALAPSFGGRKDFTR